MFSESIEVKVGLLFENVLRRCTVTEGKCPRDNLIFGSPYSTKEANSKSLVGSIRLRHVHEVTV